MLIDLNAPPIQDVTAAIVGVSKQAISAMMTEGKLSATATQGEAVQAYCQRLRDQAAGRLGSDVGGLDLVQERAALAREQRLGIEIKNAVLRSEFAPVSLLAEVLGVASQSIVERFEQLPGLLKKACPDLPDAARGQVMTALAGARNEWVRATELLVLAKLESTPDDEVVDV